MKAIFIAYNQAYGTEITDLLESLGQKGFTQWVDINGRGGVDGEPHLGDHAWPVQNYAVLTIVPDDKAPQIMSALNSADQANKMLGLRAFQWNVESAV